MKNLRITTRPRITARAQTRAQTRTQIVHQVSFEALHADGSIVNVNLEVHNREAAARLFDALNKSVAYAESDPQ